MPKWEFYDPVAVETYTFVINPSEGGTPKYEKKIIYEDTSAPDGRTLIFEGRDMVQELTFSGTILEEDQHDAYLLWFQKRRQIRLTDDFGRVMWIYIKSYAPDRAFSVSHPWRHKYSITATILSWE
jgi:hypothetical protein